MRLLVLVAVAILVWLALESLWRDIKRRFQPGRPVSRPGRATSRGGERLIRCARCGVYVPVSRAHRDDLCGGCLEQWQAEQSEPQSGGG